MDDLLAIRGKQTFQRDMTARLPNIWHTRRDAGSLVRSHLHVGTPIAPGLFSLRPGEPVFGGSDRCISELCSLLMSRSWRVSETVEVTQHAGTLVE